MDPSATEGDTGQTPVRPDDDRLARLVHVLADAVVVADRGGSIVLWNDSATSLFGWTADEAVGQSLAAS